MMYQSFQHLLLQTNSAISALLGSRSKPTRFRLTSLKIQITELDRYEDHITYILYIYMTIMNFKTMNDNYTGISHIPVEKQLMMTEKKVIMRGYLPPHTIPAEGAHNVAPLASLYCSNTHQVATHALLSHDDFQYCWCIVEF